MPNLIRRKARRPERRSEKRADDFDLKCCQKSANYFRGFRSLKRVDFRLAARLFFTLFRILLLFGFCWPGNLKMFKEHINQKL